LSGGERTKVALARILTSGLEIEAQEAMQQALQLYPGTVFVVSS
jgi:ATPase subunit of ABC transporter with duplicated ATPase domains